MSNILTKNISTSLLTVIFSFSYISEGVPSSPSPAPIPDMSTHRNVGKVIGSGVQATFGSSENIESRIYSPLATGSDMSVIDDSESFNAQLTCSGQEEILKIIITQDANQDINTIQIYQDYDVDGSFEEIDTFNGPFSSVCSNGMLLCDSGTTDSCYGKRWEINGTSLIANRVAQNMLGGCYCFNSSCGSNLLNQNKSKVLEDIGLGILHVINKTFPSLSFGYHTVQSNNTVTFSGQSCSGVQASNYYDDPGNIKSAVDQAGGDSDSLYYKVKNLGISSQAQLRNCSKSRRINVDGIDVDDVLSVRSPNTISNKFSIIDCGVNCREYRIGKFGDDIFRRNSMCPINGGSVQNQATFTINYPSSILSAKYIGSSFDDHISVRLNNYLVWAKPSGWMGDTRKCWEDPRRRGLVPANIDVTSRFSNVDPGDNVELYQTIDYGGEGDGLSVFRLKFGKLCNVSKEVIDNGCSILEENARCSVFKENVDGIETISDSNPTGTNVPLSRKDISSINGSCVKSFNRAWWNIDRVYTCNRENTDFESKKSILKERYERIHSSFQPSTGEFTDKRGGVIHTEQTVLPSTSTSNCQKYCKTKKKRSGAAVGKIGASEDIAWDYNYYECSNNVCPVKVGETIIEVCGCNNSSFTEAFMYMQIISQSKQDTICP